MGQAEARGGGAAVLALADAGAVLRGGMRMAALAEAAGGEGGAMGPAVVSALGAGAATLAAVDSLAAEACRMVRGAVTSSRVVSAGW